MTNQPPQQPYPGQPNNPGYPQGGYQQPPKKKRRVWLWVLFAFLAIIILGFVGCTALVGGVANEIDKDSKAEATVTYEVTTGGQPGVTGATSGAITYTGSNGDITQDTAATLPWTKDVTITGLGKFVSLSVSNDENGGSIICTIRQGETVISTNTANGPFASASCSGSAEADE